MTLLLLSFNGLGQWREPHDSEPTADGLRPLDYRLELYGVPLEEK